MKPIFGKEVLSSVLLRRVIESVERRFGKSTGYSSNVASTTLVDQMAPTDSDRLIAIEKELMRDPMRRFGKKEGYFNDVLPTRPSKGKSALNLSKLQPETEPPEGPSSMATICEKDDRAEHAQSCSLKAL